MTRFYMFALVAVSTAGCTPPSAGQDAGALARARRSLGPGGSCESEGGAGEEVGAFQGQGAPPRACPSLEPGGAFAPLVGHSPPRLPAPWCRGGSDLELRGNGGGASGE